jgi:hypothetical protein
MKKQLVITLIGIGLIIGVVAGYFTFISWIFVPVLGYLIRGKGTAIIPLCYVWFLSFGIFIGEAFFSLSLMFICDQLLFIFFLLVAVVNPLTFFAGAALSHFIHRQKISPRYFEISD